MGKPYERNINVLSYPTYFGNILCYDNFEDLLKWEKTGTGADYICEKFNTLAYNGSYSLRLKTRATNPAANDYVQAKRQLTIRASKQLLISLNVNAYQPDGLKYIEVLYSFSDQLLLYEVNLRYSAADGLLYISTPDGSAEVISTSALSFASGAWANITLIFNLATAKWKTIYFASSKFDVSAYSIRTSEFTDNMLNELTIKLTALDNNKPEILVDDFLCMEI
jgi:hypothetical protein